MAYTRTNQRSGQKMVEGAEMTLLSKIAAIKAQADAAVKDFEEYRGFAKALEISRTNVPKLCEALKEAIKCMRYDYICRGDKEKWFARIAEILEKK